MYRNGIEGWQEGGEGRFWGNEEQFGEVGKGKKPKYSELERVYIGKNLVNMS